MKTFHFSAYEPAIRYHISSRLIQRGWRMVPSPKLASFSDVNLTLNDSISQTLEYKHLLSRLSKSFFHDLMPETYVLDDVSAKNVLEQLTRHKEANRPWILKPSKLNNGDFVFVFQNIGAVKQHVQSSQYLGGEHVLQRYIECPALWEGRKVTFRLLVVLTNDAGVFIYHQGYFNISGFPYTKIIEGIDRRTHITNYFLDRQVTGATQHSTNDYPDFDAIFPSLCDGVKQVISGLLAVYPEYLKQKDHQSFEIFGFDFMLDDKNRPWLLEVNQGPDFPQNADHALYPTLWSPFWEHIIEQFVEPVALNQAHHPDLKTFRQVMSFQETQQVSWCKKLRGYFFYQARQQ